MEGQTVTADCSSLQRSFLKQEKRVYAVTMLSVCVRVFQFRKDVTIFRKSDIACITGNPKLMSCILKSMQEQHGGHAVIVAQSDLST
jgi:hypothetical protein